MRNPLICVVTKSGKPRKVSYNRADEIVEAGGKFISRTRYKALMSGVAVPEKLFKKGDRAVKNFIAEKLESEKKSDQPEAEVKKSKKNKKRKASQKG